MEIVIYPDGPWSAYPFASLAILLSSLGNVRYVTERDEERLPSGILPIARQGVRELTPPYLSCVSHPYWIYEASSQANGPLVALLPAFPNDQGALLRRTLKELCAVADLLCTGSEAFFLEQAFRREAVLLLAGEDPTSFGTAQVQGGDREIRDYEALFLQSIRSLINGENHSAARVAPLQWSRRIQYYEQLRRAAGPHETISFLLGSYEYLMGELDAAELHVAESFRQACMNRSPGCLVSHYRFLSAIAARKGDLARALDIYGISATTDSEQADYGLLLRWANQGSRHLAQAGLFRLNDDISSSLAQLRSHVSDSDEVRLVLFELLLDGAHWEEALALIQPSMLNSLERRRIFDLVAGFRHRLRGQRHLAISSFLRAAETDLNALAHILEIKAIDEELNGLVRLKARDLPEESEADERADSRLPSGPQAVEQQADRNDASSQ